MEYRRHSQTIWLISQSTIRIRPLSGLRSRSKLSTLFVDNPLNNLRTALLKRYAAGLGSQRSFRILKRPVIC